MDTYLVLDNMTKKLNGRVTLIKNAATILQKEIDEVKLRHLPNIKILLSEIEQLELDIKEEIKQSTFKFKKPKTRVFNNIKIGLAKSKQKLSKIKNEERTIGIIETDFKSISNTLITTKKTLNKNALLKLEKGLLKAFNLKKIEAEDLPIIKLEDKESIRLMKSLSKDYKPY